VSQRNNDNQNLQYISALAPSGQHASQPVEQSSSQELKALRQFFDLLAIWDQLYSEKVRDD
jgi:hypothetical protein